MKRIAALLLLVITTQATAATRWRELRPTNLYVQDIRPRTSQEWEDALVKQTSKLEVLPGSLKEPARHASGGSRTGQDFQTRVVNGSTAARGQFPWHAHIVLGGSSFCGGSLISDSWTLTTAHCLSGFASFTVTLGATNVAESQEGSVAQLSRYWVVHSAYDGDWIRNDIAIVKLQNPVTFTDFISPVRLPKYSQVTQSFSGLDAITSGFGRLSSYNDTYSPTLQFTQVKIITNDDCVTTFPLHLMDSNICSTGEDGTSPCNGDSGGPLVIAEDDGLYTIVGIMSFGKKDCPADAPVAFVRVTSYLRWIQTYSGIAVGE